MRETDRCRGCKGQRKTLLRIAYKSKPFQFALPWPTQGRTMTMLSLARGHDPGLYTFLNCTSEMPVYSDGSLPCEPSDRSCPPRIRCGAATRNMAMRLSAMLRGARHAIRN